MTYTPWRYIVLLEDNIPLGGIMLRGHRSKRKVAIMSEKTEEKRNEKDCCACSEKHKERSPEEYRDLINRLSRIEGQVRGIKAMVERGAYCPDILVQTSAVNSALNSFSKVLLSNHIRTCVRNDIREGNDEVVEELVATLQKMMK